jgi:uncharacterized protein
MIISIMALQYWANLYRANLDSAYCVDIETEGFNKPISVIGFYKPQDGIAEVNQFVRGQNLDSESIRNFLIGCRLLITFNGRKFDIPRIESEFPGSVPKVPIIDLYLFARELNLNTNLKVLEKTFMIDRTDQKTERRRIAVKLWWRYKTYNDQKALATLLEYNKQDTINLYPLAEKLISMVE